MGSQVSSSKIKQVQNELSFELNDLKKSVKLKGSEIERLNEEISNLQTLVQIESLKIELTNLKVLSSKRKVTGSNLYNDNIPCRDCSCNSDSLLHHHNGIYMNIIQSDLSSNSIL